MDKNPEPHICSPSHTDTAEAAKIAATRRRPDNRTAEPSLLPWSFKKPVTVRLVYRGGSQGWVEVRGRGRTRRYMGTEAIHDVLMDFLGHPRWSR